MATPCTFVLLVILSIAGDTAALSSTAASQAVLVSGKVAWLSPSEAGRQVISLQGLHSFTTSTSRIDVRCMRIDLQPHGWSWKQLVWGTVEATVSAAAAGSQETYSLTSERASGEGATKDSTLQTGDNWQKNREASEQFESQDNWQRNREVSATEHGAFFVALVALSECTPGAAVNATLVCKGHAGAPCRLPVSWSQCFCLCLGHGAETPENPPETPPKTPPETPENLSGTPPETPENPLPSSPVTPKECISKASHSAAPPPQLPGSRLAEHSITPPAVALNSLQPGSEPPLTGCEPSHKPRSPPLLLLVTASVRVPQLSVLLTVSGLLVLSSAEPLSRVSAMHILLGGMLGAGLAHVGVMLAIAAVPGAVVALPWVAALSAYRLGICEAIAMLVAGYVYTVAMALALLYLYTQHFSYVQAVYLFVMFHAALAGALRAEPLRSSNLAEAPAPPLQVAAILGGGSAGPTEQNWVTMWVPGRGMVLQRTVYFALLACGGGMFAGTINIWLHAAILRAHSSHELPLWLALFVASAPVFVLMGLEIHCKLLSTLLGAALSLPGGMLEEGADLLRLVRRRLGYYVPGEARRGGSRYQFRPVRRVFYSHVLREQEPGVKWGPERDLWLLKKALRRIGYWLAGVKPPVTGSSLSRGREWAGRGLPSGSEYTENEGSGDSSSDPTWSPSFEGSAVGGGAAEDDGQEASSALRDLPRGSAGTVDRADETALRESRSEGAPGREATCRGVWRFLRAESEPRAALERGDHPGFAFRKHRSDGRAESETGTGTETGAETRTETGAVAGTKAGMEGQVETDAPEGGADSWGEVTCRDDQEFDENVNEEGRGAGALAGAGEEWDWLAAEGLTPGEALAGQSCPVCLSMRKNLAFGCGHQTCQSCGAGLAKCPICRKRIAVRVQLFH